MKIQGLKVKNFRAVVSFDIANLQDVVVLAGPNGSGKSCILDAIRLIKSAYGGYQRNEWNSWFGEFQISLSKNTSGLLPLFHNRDRPIDIGIEILLTSDERQYLLDHGESLLADNLWQQRMGEETSIAFSASSLVANLWEQKTQIDSVASRSRPQLDELLRDGNCLLRGALRIDTAFKVSIEHNVALRLLFAHYDTDALGIIDYYGAARTFARENIGGINVSVSQSVERMRQGALYNYSNKFSNLKSEMATSYIRSLLARESGSAPAADLNLHETMKELFSTFVPGKEFLGPTPSQSGALTFPVKLANGAVHDIDELSTGEKEIVYGYLRLRNSSPRQSVIMIDEPELHLNPRLISGLATFYHKHIGKALGNQLWLVTHSDALIRDTVGQRGFDVFHIHPAVTSGVSNQAVPVAAGRDFERLIVDLVGDLAAYKPGGKIVVFEGGEPSDFDLTMTTSLFPSLSINANCISGGNKTSVSRLFSLLKTAREAGALPFRAFAIVDGDNDTQHDGSDGLLSWDVYHIENYLLHEEYILRAMQDISATPLTITAEDVTDKLKDCASQIVEAMVAHEVYARICGTLQAAIDVRANKGAAHPSDEFVRAISVVRTRLDEQMQSALSRDRIEDMCATARQRYRACILDGTWKSRVRGRDVLKQFVNLNVRGIGYEVFRNMIFSKMRMDGYQPAGMRDIVDKVLEG